MKKMSINLNRLTLGEMAEVEELGGDFEKPQSIKTIIPLIYVVRKREDPTVTLEQVKAFTMDDVEFEDTKLDPKDSKNSEPES